MATVGALVVDIQANTARLQTDMAKVRKQMNGFSKSARSAKKSLDHFQQGAMAIAKVTGAVIVLDKAWNLAFSAAKFQQAEQGFANLSASYSASSKQIISDLQKVSAGTISTANLMKDAGTAMLLGIPAEQLTKLMEIARASSRITGDSISKSFQDVVKGVGRGSKLVLDNLGLMLDTGKANEEYAKQLGKTVGQLTDAEKKQAFFNATVKAGDKIIQQVGVRARTSAEAMEAFKASIEDLKIVLGKIFISISSGLSSALLAASSGFQSLLAMIAKSFGKLLDQMSKIPIVGEQFRGIAQDVNIMADALNESSIATAGQALASFDVATGIWNQAEALDQVNIKKQESLDIDIAAKDLEREGKAREELGKLEAPEFKDGGDPLVDKFASELELIQEHAARKTELLAEAGATQEEMQEAFDERERQRIEAMNRFKEGANKKIVNATIALGMAALAAAGISGKKLFIIEKAVALGRAVVAMNAGAAQALALGPILGPPAAAKMYALGGINIAAIAASAIGGGGGGGGGGGSAVSLGSGGGGGLGGETPTIEAPRGNQAVTVNIQNGSGSAEYWQGLVDDVIGPAITDSQERNIDFTIQTT